MINDKNIFLEKGYVQINNFIDKKTVAIISQYFENKIRRGEWREADDSTSKLAYYADPLIEIILLDAKNEVEKICGMNLIPTYSYARVYQSGEELKPHVDRPSCEISVTVNVANFGGISPVYMQYLDNERSEHLLSPGDAVVYKGCEATHWRLPMNKDQINVQFMLHYVNQYGEHSSFAKDKRLTYGSPSVR